MKLSRLYKKLYLTIAIFLCCLTKGVSQEGEKLGSWYVYNGFFNFSPRFELFAETQIRTWEPIDNLQSFLIRPFFNFNLNENLQFGISQEYHSNWSFPELAADREETEEYRTTLQGILTHKVGRVSLQHRYRYEFRFLDESGNQRARYRLQVGIPISSDGMKKGFWFATLGNEIILNTKPKFDISQNRVLGCSDIKFLKAPISKLDICISLDQYKKICTDCNSS